MRKALNGSFEMMNVKNTVDNEYGNIPEKFKMIPIYDKRRDKRKCTLDTRSIGGGNKPAIMDETKFGNNFAVDWHPRIGI